MKRFVMMLLGVFMILSLAACTPTQEKNKTGELKETQGALTAGDKLPDQDAPDMNIIVIYSISDDGTSLKANMEGVEKPGDDDTVEYYPMEDTLISYLAWYDVVPDWVWVMDYDPGEETESAAGPGADSGEPAYTNAVLNLNCFSEDLEDEMVRKAVALTFMDNMNADSITVQIDGDDVASYTIDELQ